jgi:hypothetical protein
MPLASLLMVEYSAEPVRPNLFRKLRRRPKTTESRQVPGVFPSVREIPARA